MKVTVKRLLEVEPAISKILGKEMPFKTSYRLKRIADKVISEGKRIQETRREMITKYGEETKDGGYKLKEENAKIFKAEWEDFEKTELETDIQLIPMDCLESVSLSAIDLSLLDGFFDESKPKPAKKKK